MCSRMQNTSEHHRFRASLSSQSPGPSGLAVASCVLGTQADLELVVMSFCSLATVILLIGITMVIRWVGERVWRNHPPLVALPPLWQTMHEVGGCMEKT